jgi:hypothetical protein
MALKELKRDREKEERINRNRKTINHTECIDNHLKVI